MRFLRRSLVGIFLLSLTLGLLAWAGNTFYGALQVRWAEEQRTRPARERIFAVNVIRIQPQTITPVLTSFGDVRSQRMLDLRAATGGMIVELADSFEEGGEVTGGQLLARIDPSDAQSALDVAGADLQEAKAELRDGSRTLALALDELASARDQVRLRERAMARQKDLLDRGVGTEAAVENAELAVSAAKQAVLSRRQAIASAEARMDQAKTSLARKNINLANSERALAETQIFAGFSGTLAEVSAVQGGLVANNERLAQLVDTQALEVAFRVSTPQYTRLLDNEGNLLRAEVTVSLDIFGVDLTTKGRISRESAAVGAGQTGRLLFARIDDAKGFRPGDFATVKITEPALDFVVRVPASAVLSSSMVLVVGEGDRLEVAPVQILRSQGDDVIISARGLAGRDIVAETSPLLGAGIRVRPTAPPSANGQPAAPSGPDMVELSAERRAKLVAFIEGNKLIPADAKERLLGQLKETKVPARMVERIESRMGG
ncbi:MAG: HlyD family efflux transporter periplasmic adaptor subunit [Marinosulfonomonas sp.]|nr:HlyD family efflux transporter periplasmic adaptor subunit [Marinosulfonomonas sp.]